jgi:hypothetical protein
MKLKSSCAAIVFAGIICAQTASAQPAPPEHPKPAAPVNAGGMTEAAIEAQLNLVAKPETAERIASFKKNLYDALLKKGFNGVDAMHIVIATPLPTVWQAWPNAK